MVDAVFELAGASVDALGVDHVINVEPATGAAAVSVPIPVTEGRYGFGPDLALSYVAGAGNSPFGIGWSLRYASAVTIDASTNHPRYDGRDQYACAGDELIPETVDAGAGSRRPRRFPRGDYDIEIFRRRTSGRSMRYERCTHRATKRVHWRSRDPDDVVTVYGARDDAAGRIADPSDESCTFSWLPEGMYDARGNAVVFEYIPETASGVDLTLAAEHTRVAGTTRFAQRFLKRIRYGNTRPLSADTATPAANRFLFDVVIDYGDHGDEPTPEPDRPELPVRADPYSSFRAGFEVRTWRLARRFLVFHSFDELGDGPTLVQEMRLEHEEAASGSTLVSITQTGVRRVDDELVRRDRPPLTFTYALGDIDAGFYPAPEETNENLPQGVSGVQYRFVDLFGDGLTGILADDGNGWYYKRNDGAGRFGAQQVVAERPNSRLGRFALADFDGDGNTNLVVMNGRDAGWYELDRENARWSTFHPFPATPHVEGEGGRVELMDLTGDGLPDVVVERADRFTWFPSRGKDGFAAAMDIPKPAASPSASLPRMGEDPDLDLLFADMNGDGLPDLVRVRNGRVEYWPQIGHGRFGEAVVMDDSPMIDSDDEFDVRRLRLVDLDGSGTADLLYIGRGEIRTWTNAAGNRLVDRGAIGSLPYIEELSSARVVDFLGDGTPCLVWSSPLAGVAAPMQYLRLSGPTRPRLLLAAQNAMGLETRLEYSSSAAHYLRDRHAGRPWRSLLPSHPSVVDRLEVHDLVGDNRHVTRFEYHDGRYDSERRAFAGFDCVERFEVDERPIVAGDPDFVRAPGSCTRMFFHPGRTPGATRPARAWGGDIDEPLLAPHKIEREAQLSTAEHLDALRALRGLAIREEIFAVDDLGTVADHPLAVTQSRWATRRDERARGSHKASFTTYLADQLTASYEGQPDDPRVNHHFALGVDAYGNSTLTAGVSYPRRPDAADAVPGQGQVSAEAERHTLLSIDDDDRHDLGIPIESEQFELWLPGVDAASAPIDGDDLLPSLEAALSTPRHHHEALDGGATPRARRFEWERSRYWNADRTAPLPLGQVASPTLVHHEETACFTAAFVDDVYGGQVDEPSLIAHGYLERDGVWWQESPVQTYGSANHFFALARMKEHDGATTKVFHDGYDLAPVELRDALDNLWKAEIDYHVLSPWRVTDPNGTIAEVLRDPLGVIVVSSGSGHVAADGGGEEAFGDEPLDGYVRRTETDVASALADPRRFLQRATSYAAYDLDTWAARRQPVRALMVSRERHVHDLLGGDPETSLPSMGLAYLDGFGRTLQTKRLADPGLAFARDGASALILGADGNPTVADADERWLVSGHVVHDGVGKPVRRYEPFFSATAEFESEAEVEHVGVSATVRHDAAGRPVVHELPNGTTVRSEYHAWTRTSHDANDTVVGSLYEAMREPLPASEPEKQALLKARDLADTPLVVHLDARGVDARVVEVGTDGVDRVTDIETDPNGNITSVRDARGLLSTRERHDMAGRRVLQETVDSGRRRALYDAKDRIVESWDARDVREVRRYDALERLIEVDVAPPGEPSRLVEQLVYGDATGTPRARARNVHGQLAEYRDEAGLTTYERYDPWGRPITWQRRFVANPDERVDWADPVPLENEAHRTEVDSDALGRVMRERLADGMDRALQHSRVGGLRTITLRVPGRAEDLVVLATAEYNARGQRIAARLGNSVDVTSDFDPETFAPARVRVSRTGAATRALMDVSYTYDPAGNVIAVSDAVHQPAHPTPLLQGLTISSDRQFTYDAWYQLVAATGRVHQALLPQDHLPGAAGTVRGTRHLTLDNGAAVERYTRTYTYDLGGNLLRMAHDGVTRDWVNEITVAAGSNRALPTAEVDANPEAAIAAAHDDAGNLRRLAHVHELDWGDRTGLRRVVVIDRSAAGQPDDDELYEYGADGMRTRRITRRLVDGSVEIIEKRYLHGCEIKRVRRDANLQLERFTSFVGDGSERLAVVHRWTTDQLAREVDTVPAVHTHIQLDDDTGSSLLEVDPEGAVIAYEEYFPFGGSAFIAGDRAQDIERRDYRYRGRERDDTTGLLQIGHRYYQPWNGRWLSPDPSGPTDGQNLYTFARNNPINLHDPDGLKTQVKPGKQYHVTAAQPPPVVLRAWAEKSLSEQRKFLAHGPVNWRVENGKALFFETREEAMARSQQRRAAGINQTTITVDPKAPRGKDSEGSGASRHATKGKDGRATGATGPSAGLTGARTHAGTGGQGKHQGEGGKGNASSAHKGGGGGSGGNGTTGPETPDAASGTGPEGGTEQEAAGDGKGAGLEGTGAGAGERGLGPGGGGESEELTSGTGDDGTATEASDADGAEGRGKGDGDGGTALTGPPGGVLGGVPGGSPLGSPGGVAGGSPTGAADGGDRNGSPQGATNGSGVQPGGRDPNGTTQSPGEQRGNGGGQEPRLGRRPNEQQRRRPSGEAGDLRGEPGADRKTVLDRLTRYAGVLNFELGKPPPGGKSGGVPGGTGSGRWSLGKLGQVLYIAVTVIPIVITAMKSLIVRTAKAGAIGIRALIRQTVAAFKAIVPAARAALAFARSALARLFAQLGRALAGLSRHVPGRALSLAQRLLRFVANPVTYPQVGGSLYRRFLKSNKWHRHHWAIPRKAFHSKAKGIFNRELANWGEAGWNQLPVPGWLNMGPLKKDWVFNLFRAGVGLAIATEGAVIYGTYRFASKHTIFGPSTSTDDQSEDDRH